MIKDKKETINRELKHIVERLDYHVKEGHIDDYVPFWLYRLEDHLKKRKMI